MGRTDIMRGESDKRKGSKLAEIGVLIYPRAQIAAVDGLTDLFVTANRLGAEKDASASRALRVSHWRMNADKGVIECVFDTHSGEHDAIVALILPPSLDPEPWRHSDSRQENWIRVQHSQGSVICSICAGAFLLGGTGLLNGRVATTHWIHANELAERYPQVNVDSDQLIIDDGDIITAGGIMAWVDLGLHLIARWSGLAIMMATARFFLVDATGREQRFYSKFMPRLNHGDKVVLAVQHWLQVLYADSIRVGILAASANLGERTFLRRFHEATGLKPIEYLQHLRIEKAREVLELTAVTINEVAWMVGYQDQGAFRTVFHKVTGLSPGEYRQRFGVFERKSPHDRNEPPASMNSAS